MKCPKCGAVVQKAVKNRPRGQRYVLMVQCQCGRSVHIEGVAGVTPPKTMPRYVIPANEFPAMQEEFPQEEVA
jgi:uncharacterized Zn finger protein